MVFVGRLFPKILVGDRQDRGIRTKGRVPGISGVAIGVASTSLIMKPSPIGINDNLSILSRAFSRCCTGLPCHARVSLRLLCADLLAMSNSSKEKTCERKASVHIERI
jgi:hypothetical protein